MTKSSLFTVALLGFGTTLSPHARAEPPRLEPPRLEPPRAPVTEEEPPLRLRLYGFAQLDYLQAFQGVDPAWQAAIRPSRIATDGRFGDSPEATLSVRQSRFGVETWAAISSERLHGQFEIDLFGVGADEGQTTLRLRQAYGEWRGLLAGQANSVFMDGDIFPNFIEYWGPVGMVLYRNPQLRWTPWSGDHTLAVAIERPGTFVDAGTSGVDATSQSSIPDFTAHYRYQSDHTHFQLAGLLRDLGYRDAANPSAPGGHALGWGVHASSSARFPAQGYPYVSTRLSTVYGHGVANYMNDGGVDLAPRSDGQFVAVPLLGVVAYFELYATRHWFGTIGYSFTLVDNVSGQDRSAFQRGDYASATLGWTPLEPLLLGASYTWARRVDADGASGLDQRAQLSVKYSYSLTFSP